MTPRERFTALVTAGTITQAQADRAIRVFARQPDTDPDRSEWVGVSSPEAGVHEIEIRPPSVTITIDLRDGAEERLTIDYA